MVLKKAVGKEVVKAAKMVYNLVDAKVDAKVYAMDEPMAGRKVAQLVEH